MGHPMFAAKDQTLLAWLVVAVVFHVVVALAASGNAVLSKRETRAATGWVGVIWLAPLVGVVLYVVRMLMARRTATWGWRPRGSGPRRHRI